MMKRDRILAIVLTIILVLTFIPMANNTQETKGAVSFLITSPKDGDLKGAGHVYFNWEVPTGEITDYTINIDGKDVGTSQTNEYEYYTTEVTSHTLYVKANFKDSSTTNSDIVTFYVTKKGLCVDNNMGKNLDAKDMNMGWYYNWGTGPFSYSKYKSLDYVPMIWGTGADGAIPTIASQNYKYLLAYNEPDMGNNVGGSDINVNTAINNWPKFTAYRNIYYLGTPAPALSPSWESGTWFRTFMNNINHDTVDFIPLHCYYNNYGGVAGAQTFLKEVVDATYQLYHKPIWVTEFAVSGWGYSNAEARKSVQEFMYEVIDGLNQRDYVERYSWFSFDTTNESNGASALWTNATGKLTDLGIIYSDYGNPAGYVPKADEPDKFTFTQTTDNNLLPNMKTYNNINLTDYVNQSGVTVSASSEIGENYASNAIDNSISSRWESTQKSDPQSIVLNLGSVRNIKQVCINWEDAAAKDYTVEVSSDGKNYTTVATITEASGGNHKLATITLSEMASAQYVKINGTARTTDYGYSIFDMAVYGTDDVAVDITTPAETTTRRPEIVRPTTVAPPTTVEKITTVAPTDASSDPTSSKNDVTTKKNTATKLNIKVGKTKVTSATKKKSAKKVSIKLKKISKATGYMIQVSSKKSFKKGTVKTKYSKKYKYTFKGLKKNKKYYVRAKAYRTINKVKYYGSWSKVSKVKFK